MKKKKGAAKWSPSRMRFWMQVEAHRRSKKWFGLLGVTETVIAEIWDPIVATALYYALDRDYVHTRQDFEEFLLDRCMFTKEEIRKAVAQVEAGEVPS